MTSTLNPEWLDRARGSASSRRSSGEQQRIVALYFERGPGRYVEAEVAEAVGVNFKTVRRTNERLERDGLLVRERLSKDAGAGYLYDFFLPIANVEDRINPSLSECGGSDEQATPLKVEDRTVEPNLECGGSPLTTTTASTVFSPDREKQARACVPSSEREELPAKSILSPERSRDLVEIEKRLGPITGASFADLNAALDADRRGVVECVKDIQRRAEKGRVSNPVGLLVTMLRQGEHLGKQPPMQVCAHCFSGKPKPDAKRRKSGTVLCDQHYFETTDGLLELQAATVSSPDNAELREVLA